MKKVTKPQTETKPTVTPVLPAVMLVSVPPKTLDAFKKKVRNSLGDRKMSALIVSWMEAYINGK